MKLFVAVIFLAAGSVFSQEKSDPIDRVFDRSQLAFKEKYHRWAAGIYSNPRIMLSSMSQAYTDIPEFSEIVVLGRPAIPHIAKEIEADTDFSIFLGLAILEIMDWSPADFKGDSVQDQNRSILKRLRAEGHIPTQSAEQGACTQPSVAKAPSGG